MHSSALQISYQYMRPSRTHTHTCTHAHTHTHTHTHTQAHTHARTHARHINLLHLNPSYLIRRVTCITTLMFSCCVIHSPNSSALVNDRIKPATSTQQFNVFNLGSALTSVEKKRRRNNQNKSINSKRKIKTPPDTSP